MFPTRILLATDGSHEASLATEAAVELSNGTGSELHVVYVVPTMLSAPYPRAGTEERTEAFLAREEAARLEAARGTGEAIDDLGGSITASHYREGKPESEVVGLGEGAGRRFDLDGRPEAPVVRAHLWGGFLRDRAPQGRPSGSRGEPARPEGFDRAS